MAWFQAIVATSGSLYFSLVLGLVPCTLCWYQRIAMYPLLIIIGVGIFKKINQLKYFVLPLAFVGLIISVYHNLLQFGVIGDSTITCSLEVPCTTVNYLFGFVTLPSLSLLSFVVIIVCFLLYKENEQNN